MENIVVGDEDMVDFLVHAKKEYIMTGKNIINKGQWGYEVERLGGLCSFGIRELVRFRRQPVFWMSYAGHLMPEFMPEIIGNDLSFTHARRVNNFLNQCCLGVEPSRPFRGPEEADIRIPGFPELQYVARIDEHCLIESEKGKRKADLNHFWGTDMVILNPDTKSSTLLEGGYLGGRLR